MWARRSGMVDCTLLLDVAQLALDRRERDRPRSVGADTVGPGYAGCLEIVGQVFAWRERQRSIRQQPRFMVRGIGLGGCADYLDSGDVPVGRSVQDQHDPVGVDPAAFCP